MSQPKPADSLRQTPKVSRAPKTDHPRNVFTNTYCEQLTFSVICHAALWQQITDIQDLLKVTILVSFPLETTEGYVLPEEQVNQEDSDLGSRSEGFKHRKIIFRLICEGKIQEQQAAKAVL